MPRTLDFNDAQVVNFLNAHAAPMPLMIGSGLSAGAGLPSWAALFNKEAGAIGYPVIGPKGELPVGVSDFYQYASELVGDDHGGVASAALKERIARGLRVASTTANDSVYRIIAAMGARRILTLNYDNLLQQALLAASPHWTCKKRGEQIGAIRDNDHLMIAVHGHIDVPNTMVMTEEDCLAILSSTPCDTDRVTQELYSNNPILHVGMGFRDIAFSLRLSQARYARQGAFLQHVAIISSDVPKPVINRLHKNGFILFRRDVAKIPALLQAIGDGWKSRLSSSAGAVFS